MQNIVYEEMDDVCAQVLIHSCNQTITRMGCKTNSQSQSTLYDQCDVFLKANFTLYTDKKKNYLSIRKDTVDVEEIFKYTKRKRKKKKKIQ